MYVCIRIYLYTLVLAVCPPIWPEVPASMPRSDSRNLSGKGSLLWGTNGMRFSGRCFHSFEVSKLVRANQGSVGRRKKPAPRRDDSRRRDRRWAFENIADQKGCGSKTPGLHRLDFCWGRDRGRGRLAVAVEFFGDSSRNGLIKQVRLSWWKKLAAKDVRLSTAPGVVLTWT